MLKIMASDITINAFNDPTALIPVKKTLKPSAEIISNHLNTELTHRAPI